MKIVHGVFGLLLFLLLGLAAGGLIYASAFGVESWNETLSLLQDEWKVGLGAGILLLVLWLAYLLTAVPHRRGTKFISFEGQGGTVSISTKAVEDFIRRSSDEFAGVLSLNPVLRTGAGRLEMDLSVRVRAENNIPELCQILQQRVRENMAQDLGLTEVGDIRVSVEEILQSSPGTPARTKEAPSAASQPE